jgi:hypothetical protein
MLEACPRNGFTVPLKPLSRIALLGLLLLVGCRAPWDAGKAAQAKADAEAIMHSLQGPDMLRYRALTLPPEQQAALARSWPAIRRQVALDADEQETFNKLLTRFIEPKAEVHLQRDLNAKIKPLKSEIDSKWPLMQSSLTLLLQGWIETNSQLSVSEKAHGKALVKAIIEQMPAEWLQDKDLRQRAFNQMVAIARNSGIQNYQDYNSLDYTDFHSKLANFLAGLKELGKIYGLDWNAGQQRLEVTVISQSGDTARVLIRYPLGQKWVEFPMDLIEHNGHWYDASAAALLQTTLAAR